jgi:inner membrane protein
VDSISQLTLGAAVGVAVMGRRTAVWKAALWGAVAGTLPDLDVFVDHGDALRNMVMHRADSHALFWLTLTAPALAAAPALLHRERAIYKRWWLAMWLALVTHPLLDATTVYGTQLLRPFTDHPYGLGSMFIIDPLYTLPLILGLMVALARRQWRGLAANAAGLALSSAYLGWALVAQWHVRGVAEAALADRPQRPTALLVTPAPLNTVLWRVVALYPDGSYEEGFRSLLDRHPMHFVRHAPTASLAELSHIDGVQRLSRFTHGFFRLDARDGQAWITDLRMGQEPRYVFSFRIARREGTSWVAVRPENTGGRGDAGPGFAWLRRRIAGEDIPPPAAGH